MCMAGALVGAIVSSPAAATIATVVTEATAVTVAALVVLTTETTQIAVSSLPELRAVWSEAAVLVLRRWKARVLVRGGARTTWKTWRWASSCLGVAEGFQGIAFAGCAGLLLLCRGLLAVRGVLAWEARR